MKKRLLITSTDLMMIQFLVPHVIHLSESGLEVEIACSEVGGRMQEVRDRLRSHVKAIHIVRLVRSPATPGNIKGYGDMRRIIEAGRYDMIWTNEPVMGVATRLAARGARKRGTKVTYMVHGFHFYKGAPLMNWLVFYPIERLASRFCDEIVTINREDYHIAKKRMHALSVKYIHGIGVNTDRLQKAENRTSIRAELGLSDQTFIILSVGELNENKNHGVIIRAMAKLKEPELHYVICGRGNQRNALEKLAAEQGVERFVHFLGYRNDVMDIYCQSDLFAFPTRREGLGLAALEAMYGGLPLLTSKARGPIDYMENGKTGYMLRYDDEDGFAGAIKHLYYHRDICTRMGRYNREAVKVYCLDVVKREVQHLFGE